MNDTATNAGGWPASGMRKYLNDLDPNDNKDGVIYNALVTAIGDIIIDTKVVSSHGSGDTSNFTSTDKVYLLSTREVFGKGVIVDDTANGDTITRQLDYYKNNNVSASNYGGAIKQNSGPNSYWWLRSANSNYTDNFYSVYGDGHWYYRYANNTHGVSPAFRLG